MEKVLFKKYWQEKILYAVLMVCMLISQPVLAQNHSSSSPCVRIGAVNVDRILSESEPALESQKRINSQFSKREEELKKLKERIDKLSEKANKGSLWFTPVEKVETKQVSDDREIRKLQNELEKKTRDFYEDFNKRKHEELSNIINQANTVIKKIADAEKFDLIVQDGVFINNRIDITNKVLDALKTGR